MIQSIACGTPLGWEVQNMRPGKAGVSILRIDHLVLTVASIERSIGFYERVLGMEPVTFGAGRRALMFGACKINVHQAGQEITPHAAHPLPGSADLCLIAAGAMSDILAHLHSCQVEVQEGPVARTGAMGPMLSCYLRDPDGNLIEVSTYETENSAGESVEGESG